MGGWVGPPTHKPPHEETHRAQQGRGSGAQRAVRHAPLDTPTGAPPCGDRRQCSWPPLRRFRRRTSRSPPSHHGALSAPAHTVVGSSHLCQPRFRGRASNALRTGRIPRSPTCRTAGRRNRAPLTVLHAALCSKGGPGHHEQGECGLGGGGVGRLGRSPPTCPHWNPGAW
jgi:hypothetical protein